MGRSVWLVLPPVRVASCRVTTFEALGVFAIVFASLVVLVLPLLVIYGVRGRTHRRRLEAVAEGLRAYGLEAEVNRIHDWYATRWSLSWTEANGQACELNLAAWGKQFSRRSVFRAWLPPTPPIQANLWDTGEAFADQLTHLGEVRDSVCDYGAAYSHWGAGAQRIDPSLLDRFDTRSQVALAALRQRAVGCQVVLEASSSRPDRSLLTIRVDGFLDAAGLELLLAAGARTSASLVAQPARVRLVAPSKHCGGGLGVAKPTRDA